MSSIILSAGVRQNLLALQDTAALAATTQGRLATGRKVNSALDNPNAYFTSQSLSTRANDLSALLDQIGQAVQTITAANNGITSITTLLQSAKSIAQQAQAATAPTNTYGAVNLSGAITGTETLGNVVGTNLSPVAVALNTANNGGFNVGTDTLGSVTGTGVNAFQASAGAAGAGTLSINYKIGAGGAQNQTIAIVATDQLSDVVSKINAVFDVGGTIGGANGLLHASISGGQVQIAQVAGQGGTVEIDHAGSTAGTLTATGLGGDTGGNGAAYAATLTGNGAGSFAGPNVIGTGNAANSAALAITYSTDGNATTTTYDVTLHAGDQIGDVIANINAALGANGTQAHVVQATNAGGHIAITGLDASIKFSVAGGGTNNAPANSLSATGLDASTVVATNNLVDRVLTAGGTGSSTFTLTVNGTANTVNFGYSGQNTVSTVAGLATWLQNHEGASNASVNAGTGALTISIGAGTPNAPNTIALAATDTGVTAALGLNSAVAASNAGGLGAAGLSRTFYSYLTLGDLNPTNLSSGGNLSITINGATQVVSLAATDNVDNVVTKLKANTALSAALNISNVGGQLTLTSKDATQNFDVSNSAASVVLGLTDATHDSNNSGFVSQGAGLSANGQSVSLLDNLITAGGAAGASLTVQGDGGPVQTITFGTGSGEVQTLAELNTALGNLTGVTGSATGVNGGAESVNVGVVAGTSATSIALGGDSHALGLLGLTAGTTNGTVTVGANNSTRASLQTQYDNVLTQLDQLAKDASYNGTNLLNGDILKVTFNTDGTSSETITGTVINSLNLGLSQLNGNQFQDNTQINTIVTTIGTAVTTLANTASGLGSNLNIVQARQEFTKNLINTLQTGSDNLVLADTNLEGANMLALQTRQQLSTTALSLANQANQAVLRLFG